MKRLLSLTLTIIFSTAALLAQSQVKRSNFIYIFDCTKSMIYNDILDSSLQFLHDDLAERSGGDVTIVLFQDKPLEVYQFDGSDYSEKQWAEIEKTIRAHADKVTRTNICGAWDRALEYIDSNRYNYVYLMTDGEDNIPGQGTDAVCQRIAEWCGKFKDSHAYFVELFKDAHNPKIDEAIRQSCNFHAMGIVHDHFMSFDRNEIIVNTRELDNPVALHSDGQRGLPLKIECSDPYFTVEATDGQILDNGLAEFHVVARQSLQDFREAIGNEPEYRFTFSVKADREHYVIQNPDISVLVQNKPERLLNTKVTDGGDMGKASYHPAFLFWKASSPDTLVFDLQAVFNDEALASRSYLDMTVETDMDAADYTLFYNDREITDGTFRISADGNDGTILRLVYAGDAPTGRHCLTVTTAGAHELDRVNQSQPSDYELKIESRYARHWNPLATILFWLCIIVAGLLIVWFLLLKRMSYPTFNGIRYLTLEDKRDPAYYKNVRVRGYRQVVFCNKQPQTSALSRLFCGEVGYEVDDRWETPVTILPQGRSIRILAGAQYFVENFVANVGDEVAIEGVDKPMKVVVTVV